MAGILESIAVMVWKDVTIDMRRRVEAGSVLVFAVAAGVLASYIMGGVAGISAAAVASSLSLVLLFLAVFASLASFVREADRGTLDGLRAAPVGPEAVFLAKLVYSLALLVVNLLVYLLVLRVFGGVSAALSPGVLTAGLASSVYLAAVSSLVSAILVFSEARGVLMPVMVTVLSLPYVQLAAPVLVAAFTGAASAGSSLGLAASALLFSAVATWLSRFVLEAG